ncbi:BrnA antitoxin family protein [uncultured Nitratireductor sp.]|uniref:BrnA antitoxin family protein n=1 Tax=uncultured Nitratireductor sp. TaxID=520953 RepID=UPI00262AB432|nr:BrnA antitoxin family protein [uncultured Nitratireductor sp.]
MAIEFKPQKEFKPGRGYTKKDWDEVSDNPPLTKEQMKQAKPFREAFPEQAKAMEQEIARRGRPPLPQTKKPVTIRLNPETIEKFKATGKGWQSRISEILDNAKV